MATHNPEEVQPIKKEHQRQLKNIKARFKTRGKEFKPSRAGVVPQEYYDTLRNPDDDKFREGFNDA